AGQGMKQSQILTFSSSNRALICRQESALRRQDNCVCHEEIVCLAIFRVFATLGSPACCASCSPFRANANRPPYEAEGWGRPLISSPSRSPGGRWRGPLEIFEESSI